MAQKYIDIANAQYVPAYVVLVTDSTGAYAFDPNSLAQVITYNGNGDVYTVSVTDSVGRVFVQTYTYTSGKLTGISAWVKQ